jgi:UDP-N-acetylglucosamine/UDP-N-acetylgalactosamine diphosphorylase
VFETAFLRRVAGDVERCLPFHASAKKIPCVDAAGRPALPAQPNGTKLERFVFDALPHAARTAIVEVRREEEYSPVKNADGDDSPATARRALVAQYRAWLEAGGVRVPDGAPWIEVDHSVIDGPDDARRSGLRDAAQAGDAIRIGRGAHA